MITFGHFLPARYGSYSCTNLFGFVKTYASFNSTWVSFWQALVQMFQRGRSLRDTKTDMAGDSDHIRDGRGCDRRRGCDQI